MSELLYFVLILIVVNIIAAVVNFKSKDGVGGGKYVVTHMLLAFVILTTLITEKGM